MGFKQNTMGFITINVPVLEMWRDVWTSTLQNHFMGPFQGFKMVPCTKSRLFEVPETFLALLNGTSRQASAIFWANKVEGTNIFNWSLGTNRSSVFPQNLIFPATRVEYKNSHETISLSLF
jgi:hypothetical protein